MQVYEVVVTVMLKETHHFKFNNEKVGRLINHALDFDEELRKFHKAKTYKLYTFHSLYPVEKDGMYKAGKIYITRVRTLNRNFAKKIARLIKVENQDFNVMATEVKEFRVGFIAELETLTPVFVTIDSRPFLLKDGLTILEQRLHVNMMKKFKFYSGNEEEFADSFIKGIEVKSKTPFPLGYKGKTMLGHKLKILVNEDEQSQQLAQLAIGAGIGEKNSSLGAGYVIPTYL